MEVFRAIGLYIAFWIPLLATTLDVSQVATHIQRNLQSQTNTKDKILIAELYQLNGYFPLWIDKDAKRISALIRALDDPLFNYKNKPFEQKTIRALYYAIDNHVLDSNRLADLYARLDLALSRAFLKLVRFIVEGDVDWALVQKKLQLLEKDENIKARWQIYPKQLPSTQTLYVGITQADLEQFLRYLIPLQRRYLPLVQMLKTYQTMPPFPKIPYGAKVLKRGDRSKRIVLIKKRLQLTGDYPKGGAINDRYDEKLYRAILRFQARHLLKQDGLIDKVTTYYLNIPKSDLIRSIITNLDKTKLYPQSFEKEFIEVNLPEFRLRYYQDDTLQFQTDVIVGRIDRPTPIFDDMMEYIVLNPTWTIPDSLVRRDLIPVLKENPSYLQEHHIKVYQGKREIAQFDPSVLDRYETTKEPIPYRFVQQPGSSNALGRIKFMFPNKYAVYLHDTDNKTLFNRRYRVYSSGCMRVQKPFKLLDMIMERALDQLDRDEIDRVLASNEPFTIKLSRPLPVHIVYFTAYKENGIHYFRNDIYLYDQIIYESSQGHKKPTFTMPKKRFISVKKQRKEHMLSN